MEKHSLNKKVELIRKMWPYVEVCNNFKGGYLVITIYFRGGNHGNGKIFLQSEIDKCIDYIASGLMSSLIGGL